MEVHKGIVLEFVNTLVLKPIEFRILAYLILTSSDWEYRDREPVDTPFWTERISIEQIAKETSICSAIVRGTLRKLARLKVITIHLKTGFENKYETNLNLKQWLTVKKPNQPKLKWSEFYE
jgi:hypothetical protein